MRVSLNLAEHPAGARLELWEGASTQAFTALRVKPDDDSLIGAVLSCTDVGGIRVGTVRAGAGAVVHDRRHIARQPDDFVLLGVQHSGSCVLTQQGKAARVEPGELVLFTTVRPYTLAFGGSFEQLWLRIPRQRLGLADVALERAVGMPVGTGRGIGHPLAALAAELADPPENGQPELANATIELVRAAVLAIQPGARHPNSGQARLYGRLRRFIENHFREYDLSPRMVAREHHISTRYLHQIFAEAATTFGRAVRELRLQLAAHELHRSTSAHRTIESIARDCGFADAAHFSRSFRQAYGVSPREWRDVGRK